MNRIFISYRREDSADVAGRINDRLRQHFGVEAIFTDVDNIPIGRDFRAHIAQEVSKCDVFLAVIGRDWIGAKNDAGERRLTNPTDFVRIEIETALNRGIPVVPLLVRGADIPSPEQLPDSLQQLAFRNGLPVRADPDFHTDVDRLIGSLEKESESREQKARSGPPVSGPSAEKQPEKKLSPNRKHDASATVKMPPGVNRKTWSVSGAVILILAAGAFYGYRVYEDTLARQEQEAQEEAVEEENSRQAAAEEKAAKAAAAKAAAAKAAEEKAAKAAAAKAAAAKAAEEKAAKAAKAAAAKAAKEKAAKAAAAKAAVAKAAEEKAAKAAKAAVAKAAEEKAAVAKAAEEKAAKAAAAKAAEEKAAKVAAAKAAKEIDTETYDKNLWAKALVETEGDQTKRKARYIELRADQLYSESVASSSDATMKTSTSTGESVLSNPEKGNWKPAKGEWRTEWGSKIVRLKIIDGTRATYNHRNGRILISSIDKKGKWEGYWVEDRGTSGCGNVMKDDSKYWGKIIFQFNDNYTRFRGTWDNCGEGRKTNWNGYR